MSDEINGTVVPQNEEPVKEEHVSAPAPAPVSRREGYGDRPIRKRHNGEDYDSRDKGGESGRFSRFKKKGCRFCRDAEMINYKKVDILERFITDGGKILPRRVTGTCAKHQRIVAREIKKARIIALLPFIEK